MQTSFFSALGLIFVVWILLSPLLDNIPLCFPAVPFAPAAIRERDVITNKAHHLHMLFLRSPIPSIPGISYCLGAMIISEIGDFSNFSTPDKVLAFAGLSPSTYQ